MIDSTLLTTGALIAGFGTIVVQLRSIPLIIYRRIKRKLIYTTKIYQYDRLFDYLEMWFAKNHQSQYKDVEASISIDSGVPFEDTTIPVISYKQEDNFFVLKYKGKRILVSKNKEKLDKAQNLKEIYFRKYVLSGILAKKQIEELLQEALKFGTSNQHKNSIKCYTNSQWGDWSSGKGMLVKPIDKVILPLSMKNTILKDIDDFVTSSEWYYNVSIPYKRGYCFYGPPGTGKTTLAMALANYSKRDVYCLNLNAISSDDRLPVAISNIPYNSILLIEDIDKVFSGRDNVRKDSKVSFSSFLNCLDGAFYRDGLITIITTNHIDQLDEALLRTGRIDVKLEVEKPTYKEISEYLTLFYGERMELNGNFDLRMSDVQEICLLNRDSPNKAKQQILLTKKLSDVSRN